MSIKVSDWVWKHSTHRGSVKVLLLALARYANDSGICWPSARALASDTGEGERRVRQIIKELVDAGDLLVAPGGGRGRTTKYGIAVGLTDKQRERLRATLKNTEPGNSETRNSEAENSDLQNTVSGFSEIQSTETVKSTAGDEGSNSAPECAKPPRRARGIRHGTMISTSPNGEVEREGSKTPPAASDHQALMTAYQAWLGYPIPNGGKEGAAARRLLKAGYTVAQVEAAYHELKAREFYSRGHLSLVVVHEQIGALLASTKRQLLELIPAPPPPPPPDAPRRLSPKEAAARVRELEAARTTGGTDAPRAPV